MMTRMLFGLRINRRLATTLSLCSTLVLTAGAFAMSAAQGVLIASIFLTGTFLLGMVGIAYANDRTLGYGIAVLMAAALPLFLGLQAIGFAILKSMGLAVAGGLLVTMGSLLSCFAIWSWIALDRMRSAARS